MTSRMRAWWDAPAASPAPPRRVWRDWVLVAAVPVCAVLEAAIRSDVPWRWVWAAMVVALAPTLLWRRVRPFTMFATAFGVSTAASLVLGGAPEFFTTAFFLVLAYAVMRWGSGRAIAGGLALLATGIVIAVPLSGATVGDTIGAVAVVTATTSIGLAFRWRAGERARELEHVRLVEREQLARDLHDTVAHHVSAIAIQAQAGQAAAPADPAAATAALGRIDAEAARTLDELRSMVRVLRADDEQASLAPTPGIDDVRALARPGGAPGGGPAVEVCVEETEPSIAMLPTGVGATVFRIAQEAVTNARRHARGATVIDVRVEVGASEVRLDVRDDGTSVADAPPGYGLRGMAERAALLGGSCQAGPASGGGWRVAAVLPIGRTRRPQERSRA